jgi:ribulose-bisphosphate carboxylase large chain
MVADVVLSPTLLGQFLGPRFGAAGLREVLGVPRGPLLCTALKPMGSTVAALAEMAYAFAKGGIDIIKDDHGLANQRQGLTLVHFSAQPEPFQTQNTP